MGAIIAVAMSTSAENKDYKVLYESTIRVNNDLTDKIEQLRHELNQPKKMILGVRQG